MSSKHIETADLDAAKIPRHVAIIMDGNGRWAKKRLLNRTKGHEKGVEIVRVITRACREVGVSVLTLYTFSTENWNRPAAEIQALIQLLKKFLVNEEQDLIKEDIRLGIIGQPHRFPQDVRETIDRVVKATNHNKGLLLNLALSYGSRTEITEMVRKLAMKVNRGEMQPDAINEQLISDNLYTQGLPDPDLLIRTSGEWRLSNFLLWQLAYTELAVTETLWPDFTREEFLQILKQYQQRERRFGKTSDQRE